MRVPHVCLCVVTPSLTGRVKYEPYEGIHLTSHTLPDGGREVYALVNPGLTLAVTDRKTGGVAGEQSRGDAHAQG